MAADVATTKTDSSANLTIANLELFHHDNCYYPTFVCGSPEGIASIKTFEMRSDDILVATYPKSGTTWLQEIVWHVMMVNGAVLDQTGNQEERCPMIGFSNPGLEEIARRKSPRLCRTHVPYSALPSDIAAGKCKIDLVQTYSSALALLFCIADHQMLYVARNVKDVCVSMYYFTRGLSYVNYRGPFSEYIDTFINGKIGFGPWTDHVLGYWQHKDDENVLFLTYEQMNKDPSGAVKQVARFLDVSLTDDQLFNIVRATSFNEMKDNPDANFSWWKDRGLITREEQEFTRKGIVGDWKNHFTTDEARRIEDACEAPLKQHGLVFAYD